MPPGKLTVNSLKVLSNGKTLSLTFPLLAPNAMEESPCPKELRSP